LVVLLVGYAFLPLADTTLQLLYDGTAVLALATGFWGLRTYRPAHPRGWLLLLAGLGGWVAGDLIWQAESWNGTSFPAPSDAVYLASYVLLGAGVLAMVRTRRSGSDRAAFLDAAILTTGIAVLTAVFVIAPVGGNVDLSTSAKVVAAAYPVGDVFLLATLARMLTSPGSRSSSYRLLMAALLVTTVTDVTWNLLVSVTGDASPDRRWTNVGWLCGYVLVALAANRPAMAQVAEPAPPSDVRPFGRRRVVAMAVGLLLPPTVLFLEGLDGQVDAWPVIAAGAAVMSVLVLLRFVDLFSVVQTQAVQLAALARTDALTGAANRRTWDHELSRACQFARDHHRRLSVAILDIDHFKSYNDSHGHLAGDEVLRACAKAWDSALRGEDTIVRFGGEEFLVLLPDTAPEQAAEIVERLRRTTPMGQTCSAGLALWDHTESIDDLLRRADEALYLAKASGRNQLAQAQLTS
jgi:diguanylate cyclase (GGDEF)-like protein